MGVLVLLFLALTFAVQLPAVQTALARYAAGKLSEGMDGRVEIGSVRLHPFNAVTVKDIVILDDNPAPDIYGRGSGSIDTLGSIGSLSATISPAALLKRKYVRLDRVDAKDVNFNLVIEPGNEKGGTNLTRVFHLYGGESSGMPLDTLFSIGRAQFTNARYRMINMGPNPSTPKHGINYEDMDLRFNLTGHDVSMHGGRMHAVVDHLDAIEKCGYNILDASGSCAVGMGHTNIRNFRLKDAAGSNIRLPRFNLNYEGDPSAWSDFLHKVEFDASIARGSHLVFHSIGNFSGDTFYGSPLALDIASCRFTGPISNFRISDLTFTGPDCGVSGTVNGTMSGIPSTSDMRVNAQISDLSFTTEGLTKLLADVGAKADLKSIAPHTTFTANGTLTGPLNAPVADLNLTSAIGSVGLKASAQNVTDSSRPIEFKATADADRLNLGKIIGAKELGRSDFTAQISGTLDRTPRITVDNLTIPSIEVLGYDYHDLEMEGYMIGSNAVAAFRSSDPNAVFDLAANVDWKEKNARIEAEITEFDLAATGIDRRGGKSLVSCSISGEQGFREEEPARVFVTGLQLTSDEGTFDLGDIEAQARSNDGELTLVLNSDMFDAKYKGTPDFGSLAGALRSNTLDNTIPAFFNPEGKEPAAPISKNTSLSAVFHNTDGLLAFLLPGLKIGKETALNIDAGTDGSILGYITSPSVEWNGISAKSLDVAIGNLGGSLDGTIDADRIKIGDFGLSKASFSISAADDMLGVAATYGNADLLEGGGELFMDAEFSRTPGDSLQIAVMTLPSQIDIKSNTWELGQSLIMLKDGRAYTGGLALTSGDQSIFLQGGVSREASDSLRVSFNELDVDIVNAFTGNMLGLKGILQGDAVLQSPFSKELALSAGLDLTGLEFSGVEAGDISLNSKWDDEAQAIAFNLSNLTDGIKGLDVTGSYGMKDGAVNATAVFDGFDLGVAAPFIKDILPEIGGKLTGTITAGGSTKDLKLDSESMRLDGVRFRVGYTNVAYTLDGTLGIADNIVTFNNIGTKDDFGGIGVLTGTLALGDFSAPTLNASLQMNRLKALNVPMGESGIGVYGDLAVSGLGRVTGPFSDLGVNAYISTAGAGSVNVPISSSMAASGGDLLTFVSPESDNSDAKADPKPTRKGKLTVHARASISPEVTANIEIDKDSGHVLTAAGSGTVVFDFNTAQSKVQINGDYLIDKGKYLLNIPGIVSKEFEIQQGGALRFNGDPLESTLDIKATHNVKTTLGTLLADSTAVSTRRNVVCGLNIGGKFRSPEVSFSIDVPDLEPSTKMKVEAALSTTDKVQKQFVALLLFGTFLPEENAGIVNGSNMIYANVGEIVAGQLNNILQKLDIPVDFGFGYQQDNAGTDLFDVAVSTQLFNNRLVVGGSVGNRKYSTSKSANGDIVGDLDIELKLDRSGELRFKLFSHSADEYTSSLDYSQRNGVGLSYQKEFDKWKNFFKDLFTPRKRRQQQTITRREIKRIEIQ
ncbi:MAG: translocation/assembly module TamB domain-containing protein [Bacteroidales bacterium]|nr:translocation/assembly module TamB domain-containing protein [Bacteroidales bacterium]